jgi:hypothetical protein
MQKKAPRFSVVSQKAAKLCQQLKELKDSVVLYQAVPVDPEIWTFVASLDAENSCMTFDITRNGEPVRFTNDIPLEIYTHYGDFIRRVQLWEKGGKLHESLRHDD